MIFFILFIISKILKLLIFFVIIISFIKIYIFYDKNSTIEKIINLILIDIFITNMNILTRFVI